MTTLAQPVAVAVVALPALVAGAACLLAAAYRPHGGRIAASAVSAVLAVTAGALAVPLFAYAFAPGSVETVGGAGAFMVGLVFAGAAVVLVAMAVAIQRGGDETRSVVAVALFLLAGLLGWLAVARLTEGSSGGAYDMGLAVSAAAAVAGGALLVGASGAMGRWVGRPR